MVDGYQECLHCQYTHRSFSVKYPPTFYEVHNHHTYSRHVADPTKPDDGLFLYFFPVCTLNLYGGGMSSFRVCPGDRVGETRMEFDYYFDDGKGGDEGFEDYFRFVRKVALEDFELCEVAQANLERGVYSQGVLNLKKESGVLREFGLPLPSSASWTTATLHRSLLDGSGLLANGLCMMLLGYHRLFSARCLWDYTGSVFACCLLELHSTVLCLIPFRPLLV